MTECGLEAYSVTDGCNTDTFELIMYKAKWV